LNVRNADYASGSSKATRDLNNLNDLDAVNARPAVHSEDA